MGSKKQISAGILLYRRNKSLISEVLLAHPGGPFWKAKDLGAWTIPKGLVEEGEELLTAAIRELKEEIGVTIDGPFHLLGSVRLKSGKDIYGWAVELPRDLPIILKSNLFSCEWPPKSGKFQDFPEIDRCEFFDFSEARAKLNAGQVPFIDRLQVYLADVSGSV